MRFLIANECLDSHLKSGNPSVSGYTWCGNPSVSVPHISFQLGIYNHIVVSFYNLNAPTWQLQLHNMATAKNTKKD